MGATGAAGGAGVAAAPAASATRGRLPVSTAGAAAAAAAAAAVAPGGASAAVDVVPMDDNASDRVADEAAAARARKTAAATAAAAAACKQMAAAAKGPYSSMHSCDQVVLLEDWEMWDTIAVNWCKPGKETIREIVDTWEGRDLAACVYRLDLPVLYAKRNYVQHMRRSVVDAALAHARAHPELFEAAVADSPGTESDGGPSPARVHTPPQPRRAQPSVAGPSSGRAVPRSPRSPAPAPARSAAAAAIAALHDYAATAERSEPAAPPLRAVQANAHTYGARSSSRAPPSPARGNKRVPAAEVRREPPSNLFAVGGDESSSASAASSQDSDDDSESDWRPSADPLASSLRRGGRLSREAAEHQLASAGIQRSFASGFIANAKFAAGGRSMYQLYKEVTAAFSQESAKRECLALSRILDALLRGDTSAALEHTSRRLGGVHTAAETGNWAMCERLETEAEQRSFVPDAFMRSALKSVVQMQAVKKSAAEGHAGKGAWSKGSPASGRGERRSSAKPNKKGSTRDHQHRDTTDKGNGAGTSHKKKGGSDPQ